ncbi:hypothetical protein BDA99DRAFT_535895 [Phascolomyces articulosus]|uniref:Uncharacterized protein n=1 Tax=Phascolomyces articulosus TaxID=60185 RepID=A0AAD5K2D6_9FUNG|nr:hypothetical protein BDA99DRAFT_535895 [Phascolomyces articulosus]
MYFVPNFYSWIMIALLDQSISGTIYKVLKAFSLLLHLESLKICDNGKSVTRESRLSSYSKDIKGLIPFFVSLHSLIILNGWKWLSKEKNQHLHKMYLSLKSDRYGKSEKYFDDDDDNSYSFFGFGGFIIIVMATVKIFYTKECIAKNVM